MSQNLLRDEIASRNIVLRVRNFSETSSRGSKGARERPSKTMAKSHEGALVHTAGLSLKVPRRKRDISECFPRENPLKWAWKAAKV